MKNQYQTMMEEIRTPAGLNERVLLAARRQSAEKAEPKRLARRRARPVLRAAVCAACALALVVGTVRFYPAQDQPEGPVGQTDSPAVVPVLSFGLTAYAAETGEAYGPSASGGLAFSEGTGMFWSEKSGYYTGCLFQVTGENIRQVRLSLDRGGFYRWQMMKDLTEEQRREIREAQDTGEAAPTSIDQDENGSWSTEKMTRLGADVTEDYDPNLRYGFWTSGVDGAAWREDSRAAAQASTDILNGAVLTVAVTFADGTEQTRAYRLSTGRLRVADDQDGGTSILPEWAEDGEPYTYGVLAVPEN